ncbi:MAG: response regulator [Dehalococcoidia bacterium]
MGEGTGLGLSNCNGIVQQHGEELWTESGPGEGAAYHLELPVVKPDQEVEETVTLPVEELPAATKNLLVVDDEPYIRELLTEVFALGRYVVDVASNGQEALTKVKAKLYDCIVTDLKMPGMSGQEMYSQLKEWDAELAGRVIFITGDVVSPDTSRFVSEVRNPVLSKPFDLDEIRQQVRQMLESQPEAA